MAEELIYDWNEVKRRGPVARRGFQLHDETLRDGIQNPSVVDPGIGDKLEILHLLDEVGVDTTDVGLPGAGARAFEDVLTLCKEIAEQKLNIQPTCAGRTLVNDIAPMVEVSQKAGIPVEVMTFIGSSPIRQLAEDWSPNLIIERSIAAIDFAVKEGLPVTFVTEDTTRSRPDLLTDLFRAAIDHGATRLCLCDTVGHVTPDGVRNLLEFTKNVVEGTGADVKIACQIATDNFGGGEEAGRAMIEALGEAGGKVAILHFKQAESCRLRVAGFMKVINTHNESSAAKVEVVAELEGGGAKDIGYKAGEDIMQVHPDLAGIFAINDPGAEIETVSWRARVSCRLRDNQRPAAPVFTSLEGHEKPRSRDVYFPDVGFVKASVHHFESMAAGTDIHGPAIIESPVTSIVVDPGAVAQRRATGSLVVRP